LGPKVQVVCGSKGYGMDIEKEMTGLGSRTGGGKAMEMAARREEMIGNGADSERWRMWPFDIVALTTSSLF